MSRIADTDVEPIYGQRVRDALRQVIDAGLLTQGQMAQAALGASSPFFRSVVSGWLQGDDVHHPTAAQYAALIDHCGEPDARAILMHVFERSTLSGVGGEGASVGLSTDLERAALQLVQNGLDLLNVFHRTEIAWCSVNYNGPTGARQIWADQQHEVFGLLAHIEILRDGILGVAEGRRRACEKHGVRGRIAPAPELHLADEAGEDASEQGGAL